jgi:hypothetical protein
LIPLYFVREERAAPGPGDVVIRLGLSASKALLVLAALGFVDGIILAVRVGPLF